MAQKSVSLIDRLPGFCPGMILTDVPYRGKMLRFHQPLKITPFIDMDYRVYRVDIPELDIFAWGESFDELIHNIAGNIHAVWWMSKRQPYDKVSAQGLDSKRPLTDFMGEVESDSEE